MAPQEGVYFPASNNPYGPPVHGPTKRQSSLLVPCSSRTNKSTSSVETVRSLKAFRGDQVSIPGAMAGLDQRRTRHFCGFGKHRRPSSICQSVRLWQHRSNSTHVANSPTSQTHLTRSEVFSPHQAWSVGGESLARPYRHTSKQWEKTPMSSQTATASSPSACSGILIEKLLLSTTTPNKHTSRLGHT